KNEVHLDKIEAILVAPFVEEITKGAFLFLTIRNKKFDNITDGIVYGGAIGLGFGMTENFLYFITYGDTFINWIMIVLIRTLCSAVMQCVATATFGAFLAYARFKKTSQMILYSLAGPFATIIIHHACNMSISFDHTTNLG